MTAVFAKTPQGQDEIIRRAAGLLPRVRRVLILIDGKRTQDELRVMAQCEDLPQVLQDLQTQGYVAAVGHHGQMMAVQYTDGQTFRVLPVPPEPLQQQQARNFMINTLKTFVGTVGTSSLLLRIESAVGHEGLRELYDEWQRTIAASRDGRREIENLRSKLLQVI